jgi:hypothetical protein
VTSELATAPRTLDVALLKAVGLDRLAPEQRQLALAIAERYELDLLMKHLVMIEGRPYITRDGLLHVAHRSGQLDGIETSEPTVVDDFWRSTCSVYRKDMSHAFTYTGRYPTKGGNQKFAPEMAVKVGEVMALRRAFDVSAPVLEERWDVEVPAVEPVARPTLAERAAARAAEVTVMAAAPDLEPANLTTVLVGEVSTEQSNSLTYPEHPLTEHVDGLMEEFDGTLTVSVGLSVEAFRALCVRNGKMTQAIASAIECVPGDVAERVKSMSPVERGVLADELGIDWRGAR